MDLSFQVMCNAVLGLKPLRAFGAIELAQSWKILGSLRGLVLLEMPRRLQVGVDLVEITAETASLGACFLVFDTHDV
jgi:hypothetical protein